MNQEDIEIHTETIQLDQFLKWTGVTGTGGQVKHVMDQCMILVNGVKVQEKRKKLHPGDIVEIKDIGVWRICREE